MKKTNLRINNFFIFEHNKNLFLSDINDLELWKKYKNSNLKKFINSKNDKTKKLNSLIKEFKINSNINFIIHDNINELSSPIKIIKIGG